MLNYINILLCLMSFSKFIKDCVSCCCITWHNSQHSIFFCQKLIPKKLSPSSIGWNTHESWIGGTWWKSLIIKTFKFQRKILCLCLIICTFLSMKEKIWLPINAISSNINNFNCVYWFAKVSHLSPLNGLRSLIDLLMELIIFSVVLIQQYYMQILLCKKFFKQFILMDLNLCFFWDLIFWRRPWIIKVNVFLVFASPIKNMDKGSFGFIHFLYKLSSKRTCYSHLMNEPWLKKWNMDEFHL